jgi:hypothetical protein
MKGRQPARINLATTMKHAPEPLTLFALLNLGLAQSLASGVLTPDEAVERFYHAANCLYVRRHVRNNTAEIIMSHGAQLADLFGLLTGAEARRELYAEIEKIRSLSLRLLAAARSKRQSSQAAA